MDAKRRRMLLPEKMKRAVVKCSDELKRLCPSLSSKRELENKLADIFSCSRAQIRTILSIHQSGQPLINPQTGRKPKSKYFTDHIFKEELSLHIYEKNKKNEYFTAKDLLDYAKSELEYTSSLTTLKRILKFMGYRYKKVDNRKLIIEGPRLQSLKIKFLRKYLQLAEKNVTFVYLDETWIYQKGVPVRRWVFEGDRRGMPDKVSISEGKRFTVLHAGGKSGFLGGCELFLDSKVDSKDYHKTMTGELFKHWTKQQLIPAVKLLNGKVVIVMDNAPYHSVLAERLPNSSWSKPKLKHWLNHNDIPFGTDLNKNQLWDIIKPILPSKKKYEIDELLSKNGIEVLRLPPYHCQYNPIEMVWGFCKPYYNKHILKQSSKKSEVAKLWHEALSKYTPEMWNNSVNHCEKIIKNDWKRLMGTESVQDIPPIIISLADSDDESIASFTSECAGDIVQENEQNEIVDKCSEEEGHIVCEVIQMSDLDNEQEMCESDVEIITIEVAE